MADQLERAQLVAEIAELQRQRMDATINATFVGWNPEAQAARDKRMDRIAVLRHQLAALD